MPRSLRSHWPPALIALGVLAAYANSFSGPFVFDDLPAIVENSSIRRLAALSEVLLPQQPGGLTVAGRPLVNLSFALNYAVGGTSVGGYHAINLLIHLGAALALFGFLRRTLVARAAAHAEAIALTVALVWALHPLQTESVTYLVQRAESLAGLFYLLTLYGFTRAIDASTERWRVRWLAASVAACACGMASKETVVSAPLIVLLYDRTFVSGRFADAWQRRRGYYLALVTTWVLLAFLVLGTGSRGGTAGFGSAMTVWSYALTQCRAIVHYVALVIWPSPLVFDYGLAAVSELTAVFAQAIAIVGAVVATGWALWRRPIAGFFGACFFAWLAPSSSFVPVVTQTMAEHRLYLSLAVLIAGAVIGSVAWFGRRAFLLWAGLAVCSLGATVARNRDYRSEIALWADTAQKLPANARAHNNLGQAQFRAGQREAAITSYRRALALQPRYPETHYNLGVALAARGELPAAIEHYETALRIEPDYPEALNNLGNALVASGRAADAVSRYEEALRRRPNFAEAHNNLGNALLQLDRARDAVPHFDAALRLKPDYPEAAYNWGNALAAEGDMAGALARYRTALALKADYAEAHVNAGNALLELGRSAEAVADYERAIALQPALKDAHANLGSVLLDQGRWAEAAAQFEYVLRLEPQTVPAHRALGFALGKLGRFREAVGHYETYLRAAPSDAEARAELRALTR